MKFKNVTDKIQEIYKIFDKLHVFIENVNQQ